MIFFYGRNSFKVKTVQLSEIGIHSEVPGVVQFELRQQYGHLYWIPMFPMGSQWCVRKTDNKLYEVNSELLPTLNALPRRKLGWLAFAGPIIIGLVLLYFKIFGSF
jgi:hypothetical protein